MTAGELNTGHDSGLHDFTSLFPPTRPAPKRTRDQREAELVNLTAAEIKAEYSRAMSSQLLADTSSAKVGQMIREILEREFPTTGIASKREGRKPLL